MKNIIVMFVIAIAFVSGCSFDNHDQNQKLENDQQNELIKAEAKKEPEPEDQNAEQKSIQELDNENHEEVIMESEKMEETMKTLYITINGQTQKVNVYDNQTMKELQTMLPMTITMEDLHQNEKYSYLDQNLTTQSQSVGNIQKGDVMLYGSNCLVLFYETFSTAYQYTPLGSIEDPSFLDAFASSGSIQVTFELK